MKYAMQVMLMYMTRNESQPGCGETTSLPFHLKSSQLVLTRLSSETGQIKLITAVEL